METVDDLLSTYRGPSAAHDARKEGEDAMFDLDKFDERHGTQ